MSTEISVGERVTVDGTTATVAYIKRRDETVGVVKTGSPTVQEYPLEEVS
jgi:hypothetical protein